MKINLVEKSAKNSSDIEIVLVKTLDGLKDSEILEILDFKAKDESCVLLAESKKIYVGFEENDYDSIAIAVATAIKKLQTTKFKSAKIKLCEVLENNLKALVEGALLGEYKFTHYKSEKEIRKIELTLIVKEKTSELEKVLKESKIISKAVNKTRTMVNTAPADFYPSVMAEIAQELAKDADISCEVHGEKYLEKNKMMAMHSVGRASIHESKLIHLSYKPKNDTKKIVDMIIVDDTYNHNDRLKTGMTSYKIEQVFGKADRQMFEGNTCYIYKNEAKEKLIIQIEPTDKYLESFRITNLPVELPIDTTEYLPDDATDETENPLMADKQIDTSAVNTPAKDKFQINYNYSFTK